MSFSDAVIVFSNVLDLSPSEACGPCVLTGTNFNISAAVGFISIFGVAIMDGLLLLGVFQPSMMRLQGLFRWIEAIVLGGGETGSGPS